MNSPNGSQTCPACFIAFSKIWKLLWQRISCSCGCLLNSFKDNQKENPSCTVLMCMRLCAYLSAHPKDAVCTYVCVCWLSSKVALYRSCQWEIQLTDCIPDVACTLCFQSVFQWWYAAKRLLTHIVLIQIMCVLMCVRNSKTLRKSTWIL